MAKSWPNVYPQGSGFIVDCGMVDGKRKRIYKASKTAAKDEAARLREERRRGQFGALSISDSDLMDAVRALDVLDGTGLTLEDVAKLAIKSKSAVAMTVEELFEHYEEQKKKTGLREATLRNIRNRAGRFARDTGFMKIGEVTASQIEEWLNVQRFEPTTRNTFLNNIRTLFRHAVKNQWLDRNPADFVEMVRTGQKLPPVFSIDDTIKIMAWCVENNKRLIPYFALGAFAGVRPAETRRLRPPAYSKSDTILTIGPEVTKTHMRHIDVRPNLTDWLAAYPIPADGPYFYRRAFRDMLDEIEIDWHNDVLRKSFISYHLAAFRNQQETALQAGHRNTDMLYTHYRNIKALTGERLTETYASKYWQITPDSVADWIKKKKKN